MINIKILNDCVVVVGRGRETKEEKISIVASSFLTLLIPLHSHFVNFPNQNCQPEQETGRYPENHRNVINKIKLQIVAQLSNMLLKRTIFYSNKPKTYIVENGADDEFRAAPSELAASAFQ